MGTQVDICDSKKVKIYWQSLFITYFTENFFIRIMTHVESNKKTVQEKVCVSPELIIIFKGVHLMFLPFYLFKDEKKSRSVYPEV